MKHAAVAIFALALHAPAHADNAVVTDSIAPLRTPMPVTAACAVTVTPRSLAALTYALTRLLGCR